MTAKPKTTLHLHNTLTRKKDPFVPIDDAHVRIYVCGPTVYDYAHIGNARPAVVFDVLVRLLRHLYPKVTYVRNITDVDDKINARAKETGQDIRTITEGTAKIYQDDMAALGVLPPDIEPRATDHIPEMIEITKTLIADGHAYEAEGNVLFSVSSWDEYGKLSRHNRDEIIAGARVDVAPYKKDAADFILWKPSETDVPGWDSPWGRGRPGWHLECSAMSKKYLGTTFDIHGGGQDLIFPHHENEIAQSRCANHTDVMANYWIHNGYLMSEGEKMSKSLGNFYTVHDLLDDFPGRGEAIRLVLLQTHYRKPIDFTKAEITKAIQKLNKLYRALKDAAVNAVETEPPADIVDALSDDLNTHLAIAGLEKIAGELNKASDDSERARLKGALLAGGAILGLLQASPEEWLKGGVVAGSGFAAGRSTVKGIGAAIINEEYINEQIAARATARKNKDFAASDRIRDELAAKGVVLEDAPDGTTEWRRS